MKALKTNNQVKPIYSKTRGLAITVIMLLNIQLAQAGVIQVDSTADQPQAGLTTFREAVEQANLTTDAAIVFDPDVFGTPQTITLETGEIIISSSLQINGPGAHLLTIDGDHASRILTINDGLGSEEEVQISGITFTNGNGESVFTNGSGGCILSREILKLRGSVVKNCSAAANGGGLSAFERLTLIENSHFSHNTSGNNGGGMFLQSSNGHVVLGSTFSNNAASRDGGGIFMQQTSGVQIINSTVSSNQAGRRGGGINSASILNISHSTIIDNIGTGVSLSRDSIQNSVIANNTAGDCVFSNTGFDNQNNLDTDGSCEAEAITHFTTSDPMLEPLAFYGGTTPTHRPLPGSPVIDNGDGLLCDDVDQRGEPRPQDGDGDDTPLCDIGAVELADIELVPQEVIFQDSFDEFICLLASKTDDNSQRGCR